MKYTFWKCVGGLLLLGLPLSVVFHPREPGGYFANDQLEALQRNQVELTSWSVWQVTVCRLGFGLISFAAGVTVMVLADLSRKLREAQARIEKLEGSLGHGGSLQSAEARIERRETGRRDENPS
jgi:hypothetical protein